MRIKGAFQLVAFVLAFVAGPAAASSRNLQTLTLPSVALPSITAFLPPLSDITPISLDDIFKQVGLPTWSELGLPPIAELMKPIGGPEEISLPSLDTAMAQANEVFNQVVYDMMPPEVKALMNIKYPKFNMSSLALATARALNVTVPPALLKLHLPTMPQNMPQLKTLLSNIGLNNTLLSSVGLNASALHVPASLNVAAKISSLLSSPIKMGALKLPSNMPSFDTVMSAVNQAYQFLDSLPSKDQLPTLSQIMSVINTIDKVVQGGSTPVASG